MFQRNVKPTAGAKFPSDLIPIRIKGHLFPHPTKSAYARPPGSVNYPDHIQALTKYLMRVFTLLQHAAWIILFIYATVKLAMAHIFFPLVVFMFVYEHKVVAMAPQLPSLRLVVDLMILSGTYLSHRADSMKSNQDTARTPQEGSSEPVGLEGWRAEAEKLKRELSDLQKEHRELIATFNPLKGPATDGSRVRPQDDSSHTKPSINPPPHQTSEEGASIPTLPTLSSPEPIVL
ncbi:hypothetical protein K488DRAFT_84180 [Vararia minispora EC-137]|uniref:Uncharacterized protein n=1 Tax=Vararia minispora EC-137 TaxID=1314806 RepID=A0ACB8QRG9_9AGAM|nr:hypothetical protein K488DRAFT_84180 [Vararia minispora EC-137]